MKLKDTLNTIAKNTVPLLLAIVIFTIYLLIICRFANDLNPADLICSFKWKDGMILLLSYAAVHGIIGPLFSVRTILPRVISSVLIYNVAYGLLAFPYWLTFRF